MILISFFLQYYNFINLFINAFIYLNGKILVCYLTKLINSLILHLNLFILVIIFMQINLSTSVGNRFETINGSGRPADRQTIDHWATYCSLVAIFDLLVTKHLYCYLLIFICLLTNSICWNIEECVTVCHSFPLLFSSTF